MIKHRDRAVWGKGVAGGFASVLTRGGGSAGSGKNPRVACEYRGLRCVRGIWAIRNDRLCYVVPAFFVSDGGSKLDETRRNSRLGIVFQISSQNVACPKLAWQDCNRSNVVMPILLAP